ncbi:MAG: ORF6N domain-containing protein [Deltaproteobacteria bacterium]|nr:ORF6N domain-containing protein [Deltaproteobacteria bacterium]
MKRKINALTETEIEHRIFFIRNKKTILSIDLAKLYQVEPRTLIQAVKRNLERFPSDFMFQLTKSEFENLKSQIVTSSWGGLRRALPYAFTEQGIAMLSSILKSKRAIRINIAIMRTFIRLREMILSHKDLQIKIEEMEKKYDKNFSVIFKALRDLFFQKDTPKRKIGFETKD